MLHFQFPDSESPTICLPPNGNGHHEDYINYQGDIYKYFGMNSDGTRIYEKEAPIVIDFNLNT